MVDRCLCFNKKFSQIKEIVDKNNIRDITELKKYVLFGDNCRLCLPYVERMLKTGKTEFEPMFFDERAK